MRYRMTLLAQQQHKICIYLQQEKEPHPQINKAKKKKRFKNVQKKTFKCYDIYGVSACYTCCCESAVYIYAKN